MIARYLLRRAFRHIGARIWQALEDHQWLPALLAFILLLIVNTVDGPR